MDNNARELLRHDIAQATTVALFGVVENLLFGWERGICFDEFLSIVVAALERHEADLRKHEGIKPSLN